MDQCPCQWVDQDPRAQCLQCQAWDQVDHMALTALTAVTLALHLVELFPWVPPPTLAWGTPVEGLAQLQVATVVPALHTTQPPALAPATVYLEPPALLTVALREGRHLPTLAWGHQATP